MGEAGLGHFQVLGDALMLEVLGYMGPKELARLQVASKAMYCFCNMEDLWKAHVFEVGYITWYRLPCHALMHMRR